MKQVEEMHMNVADRNDRLVSMNQFHFQMVKIGDGRGRESLIINTITLMFHHTEAR